MNWNIDLTEYIGIIFFGIALLFILIFIWKELKLLLPKIVGVLLIIALSLFANHPSTYFITIVIVATLITDLEFLLKISAIIRNSSEYFKYMIGRQTESEIKFKLKKEAEELDRLDETKDNYEIENNIEAIDEQDFNSSPNSIETENSDSSKINKNDSLNEYYMKLSSYDFAKEVEEKTINYLRKQYNGKIREHIRLTNSIDSGFDVLIESYRTNTFVEIKIRKRGRLYSGDIKRILERANKSLSIISNTSDKATKLLILVVIDEIPARKQAINEEVVTLINSQPFEVEIKYITFTDIGI